MGAPALIDRILEPAALSARFQPVFDVGVEPARWHYVECLVRGPQGTTAERPEILFDYARRKNREADVDRACVATLLRVARGLPASVGVGVNVHASTLTADTEFAAFLEATARDAGIAARRLVVEIVEHARPWDVGAFQARIEAIRASGARIAVDDVGLGESNLAMILASRPDYMKIDRYFVHGAGRDFHREAVLASIVQLSESFGARTVAEGVETEADLRAVRSIGIELAQGYLFGKPTADVPPAVGGSEPGV